MDEGDSSRGRKSAIMMLAVLLLAVMLGAVIAYVYWFLGKPGRTSVVVPAANPWQPGRAAKNTEPMRITALCRDGGGNVWAGTEGQGVWRLDATRQTWTNYTTAQGLGDNFAFALAADRQGRIWVGHLNHGVSVFAPTAGGAEGNWRNYEPVGGASAPGTLSGPLGARVAAIAVSPADGDVWMASSGGLARYSQAHDDWTCFTRESGLPEDSAKKIAFDAAGDIYVVTDTHGIAMADAASLGAGPAWRTVTGPAEPPPVGRGNGLPTNLINDVLVARDGTVYAATDSGLAWSTDRGATWQFVRGEDWVDILRASAAGAPKGWAQPPGDILREDFCTCLAEDAGGKILVGHRESVGVDVVEPLATSASPIFQDAQNVICMLGGDRTMIGTYLNGILTPDAPPANAPPPAAPATSDLPSGAKPPTLAELNRELSALSATPPGAEAGSPNAIALDDDWSTEGAWLGRYGRYKAILAAMISPGDYLWGPGPTPMNYAVMIGPHRARGDSVRYWIDALQTKNPMDLEIPPVYMDSRVKWKYTTPDKDRRPAIWNDNGYSHPRVDEGPDLYVGVEIPPGEYVLSFYTSSGGHGEMRDLVYSVRSSPQDQLYDITDFDKEPELAACRIPQLAGGVYKRFLVNGPEKLTVEIRRNHGVEALAMGVMLDLLDERPVPYFMTVKQWQLRVQSDAEDLAVHRTAWRAGERGNFSPVTNPLLATEQLMDQLHEMAKWNPQAWAYCHRRIGVELARWAKANVGKNAYPVAQRLLGSSLYESGYFPQWEAVQTALGERTARSLEKSLRWDGVLDRDSGYELENFGKDLTAQGQSPAETQPSPNDTTKPN